MGAAWNIQNILTHVIVPVASVVDYGIVNLINRSRLNLFETD